MNTFNHSQFGKYKSQAVDPDADLMRVAVKLPMVSPSKTRKKIAYIPSIPQSFITATVPAGDSLGLLLTALAHMRMSGTAEISIGAAIWRQIGNPTKRVRTRLLRQIGKLPRTLCRLLYRKGRSYLLVTGKDWPTPFIKSKYTSGES